MTVPQTHLEESLKLQAQRPVDLWEFQLRSGARFYLRDGVPCTWQGKNFSACTIRIGSEGEYADDQVAKPTLTIHDYNRVIGPFASQGLFDSAIVYRYRVLQAHLNADLAISQRRLWLVGRPSHIGNQQAQFELRSPYDIPEFTVPPRMFMPPEFPFVTY